MIGEKGRESIAGNMKENVAHEPAPSLRRGDASIEGDRWKQAQNHESILDVCTFRAKQNAGHQSREESPLTLQSVRTGFCSICWRRVFFDDVHSEYQLDRQPSVIITETRLVDNSQNSLPLKKRKSDGTRYNQKRGR